MIPYTLAKSMKEAGYLQGLTENQYGWVEAHNDFELNNGDMTKGVSAPTLEEIIDSLGDIGLLLIGPTDTLKGIVQNEFGSITPYVLEPENSWRAISIKKEGSRSLGPTPLIAACNLWLAVNKK